MRLYRSGLAITLSLALLPFTPVSQTSDRIRLETFKSQAFSVPPFSSRIPIGSLFCKVTVPLIMLEQTALASWKESDGFVSRDTWLLAALLFIPLAGVNLIRYIQKSLKGTVVLLDPTQMDDRQEHIRVLNQEFGTPHRNFEVLKKTHETRIETAFEETILEYNLHFPEESSLSIFFQQTEQVYRLFHWVGELERTPKLRNVFRQIATTLNESLDPRAWINKLPYPWRADVSDTISLFPDFVPLLLDIDSLPQPTKTKCLDKLMAIQKQRERLVRWSLFVDFPDVYAFVGYRGLPPERNVRSGEFNFSEPTHFAFSEAYAEEDYRKPGGQLIRVEVPIDSIIYYSLAHFIESPAKQAEFLAAKGLYTVEILQETPNVKKKSQVHIPPIHHEMSLLAAPEVDDDTILDWLNRPTTYDELFSVFRHIFAELRSAQRVAHRVIAERINDPFETLADFMRRTILRSPTIPFLRKALGRHLSTSA